MPSDRFREELFSPEAVGVWAALATITHDNLATPVRIANNNEDVTSRGNVYSKCPFSVKLPIHSEDGPPGARLRAPNVSQDLVATLREIDSPASIKFEVVLIENPDFIEIEYGVMQITFIRVTTAIINAVIGLEDLRVEPYPAHGFVPTYFPGLFK